MSAKKTKKAKTTDASKPTEFRIARAVADANGIKDGDPAADGAVYRVHDDVPQTAPATEAHDHVREVDGKDVVFRVEVDDHDPVTNGSADAPTTEASTPSEPSEAPVAKKTKPKKAKKPEGELTIALLAEGYLHALEDSGAGNGTIASYGMELKLAMKELGSETPVATLTDDRVRNYFFSDAVMKTRAGKLKAPPTYLKSQRVFRQALAWAQTEKLIEKAPIPELKAKQ